MNIVNSIEINAPLRAAWQILGEEFGEVSDWPEPVVASSLDGPLDQGVTRICNIKATGPFPAGKITETLSEFNREEKTLTYVVASGRPPFLEHLQNRWVLEARGDAASVAKSTISYRVKWWAVPFAPLVAVMLKRATKPIFTQFQDAVQLRHHSRRPVQRRALTHVQMA